MVFLSAQPFPPLHVLTSDKLRSSLHWMMSYYPNWCLSFSLQHEIIIHFLLDKRRQLGLEQSRLRAYVSSSRDLTLWEGIHRYYHTNVGPLELESLNVQCSWFDEGCILCLQTWVINSVLTVHDRWSQPIHPQAVLDPSVLLVGGWHLGSRWCH